MCMKISSSIKRLYWLPFIVTWIAIGYYGQFFAYHYLGDIQSAGWEFGIVLFPLGLLLNHLIVQRTIPSIRTANNKHPYIFASIAAAILYVPTLSLVLVSVRILNGI